MQFNTYIYVCTYNLNTRTGTLEWSFGMERSICIPTYLETEDTDVDTKSYSDVNPRSFGKNDIKNINNNVNNVIINDNFDGNKVVNLIQKNDQKMNQQNKENQKHETNEKCFSMQLSLPDFPTNPVFEFKNAWAIEKGSSGILLSFGHKRLKIYLHTCFYVCMYMNINTVYNFIKFAYIYVLILSHTCI